MAFLQDQHLACLASIGISFAGGSPRRRVVRERANRSARPAGRLAPLLEDRVVQLHLPDDLLMVEPDYLHIDQVLTNLLENAVHYTPASSLLEISARLEGEQVIVSVADRGPGTPPAHLERVFDKFYRVLHGQPSGGYPRGSGLGLAVCRGLVEAHGGRIWAEPREGGGLVVFVVLPVREPQRISV